MPPAPPAASPAAQRATDASLGARLAAALDRNKQLADENARLRRQLAPRARRPAVSTAPNR